MGNVRYGSTEVSHAERLSRSASPLPEGRNVKLLILGATGQTGRELVVQGLNRGHDITALVRSPHKIPMTDARLEVAAGSPLDERLLARALAGKDAVLSALGHTDLKPCSLVTEGAAVLVEQMRRQGVKRLVIISSTLVAPGGSLLTRIPRYLTRHALNDSARMEEIIRPAPLDWTVVRLTRLTNGPESTYRIFDNEPSSVSASVSRKTVAACILDLLAKPAYFGSIIGVRAARRSEIKTATRR
jgi:putative NADH-flavin reductase